MVATGDGAGMAGGTVGGAWVGKFNVIGVVAEATGLSPGVSVAFMVGEPCSAIALRVWRASVNKVSPPTLAHNKMHMMPSSKAIHIKPRGNLALAELPGMMIGAVRPAAAALLMIVSSSSGLSQRLVS